MKIHKALQGSARYPYDLEQLLRDHPSYIQVWRIIFGRFQNGYGMRCIPLICQGLGVPT